MNLKTVATQETILEQPQALLAGRRPITEMTPEKQAAIYAQLRRQAALGAGIEALALRSIESGEGDPLEHIAELAAVLSLGLAELSSAILQIQATKD